MIRFIVMLCLLLLSSVTLAQPHSSQTTIKIGYPAFDWAPFSYVSANGHVSGYSPPLFMKSR
ncbi:hypothetical protein JCM19237_215 [Photobacterium aphoticum]|uniref:Uncharacterized protein n=1 Tax=Photobacterium aphoticum TaxID=754436 RepID=A0A090QZ31_9GAMM|nr:hypothetical protein JCM19237_215 [Photobacterium aphoticum]